MNKEIDWQGIAKCWETLVKENERYKEVLRKLCVAMRGAGVPENVIEAIFNKESDPTVIYTKGLKYLEHEVVLRFSVKDYELEDKKGEFELL